MYGVNTGMYSHNHLKHRIAVQNGGKAVQKFLATPDATYECPLNWYMVTLTVRCGQDSMWYKLYF